MTDNKLTNLLNKYDIKGPTCFSGVDDGWLPIVEELIQKLIAAGWDKNLAQVKEKFGTISFYLESSSWYTDKDCSEPIPEEQSKVFRDLIDEATYKSSITCERCGKPGKTSGKGWIKTLCDEHA